MTYATKILAGAGAALVAAGIGIVAVNRTASTPLASIEFSQAPYAHSGMTWQAGQRGKPRYSGPYIATPHQWGVYVVNTPIGTSSFKMISPVGKVSNVFQPPIYRVMGDSCWGSVSSIAVTPFTPKWIVTNTITGCPKRCADVGGVPTECVPRQFPDEIQVMRLDPPGFRFVGPISAPKVSNDSELRLDGDVLWARQKLVGIPPVPKWTKIDLTTLSVVAEDQPESLVSPLVLQPDIDGFTYTIAGVYPTPIPQPWPGFQKFRLTRVGGSTVTPTALPVPIPTPPGAHSQADWIQQFAAEGYTVGCGNGNYCPDKMVSRAEVSVWILTAKHGAGYVPPPCTNPPRFNDVPCDSGVALLDRNGVAYVEVR